MMNSRCTSRPSLRDGSIGNLLRENKIEKLKEYNKYYSSYLASFFDNWKKGKITLEDELKAFNRYANANKILIPQLTVSINSSIKNPEKVLFLQSVFDTLLDNSITHGFKDMESNFHFSIDIASGGNILTCVVVDNGIPPEDNNAYLATKNSGLSILRKRIQNSYSILKPWTHKGAFNIRTIPGNKGTIIKLVFPYEEA